MGVQLCSGTGPGLGRALRLVSYFAVAGSKFLIIFEQEALHFHFALGLADSIASYVSCIHEVHWFVA